MLIVIIFFDFITTLASYNMRVILFILVTCFFSRSSLAQRRDRKEADWWKTTSMYQIYPRSFKDSNGDGTGDLKVAINQARVRDFI